MLPLSCSYFNSSGEEDAEITEEDMVGAKLSETGFELVLPSGARVGHRAVRHYYKQHFRQEDNRDSVVTQRMVNRSIILLVFFFVHLKHQYFLTYLDSRRSICGPGGTAVIPEDERRHRDKHTARMQYMRQIIGRNSNELHPTGKYC